MAKYSTLSQCRFPEAQTHVRVCIFSKNNKKILTCAIWNLNKHLNLFELVNRDVCYVSNS